MCVCMCVFASCNLACLISWSQQRVRQLTSEGENDLPDHFSLCLRLRIFYSFFLLLFFSLSFLDFLHFDVAYFQVASVALPLCFFYQRKTAETDSIIQRFRISCMPKKDVVLFITACFIVGSCFFFFSIYRHRELLKQMV